MTMLWRALPVTTLTLRQFTGGRTWRLVLFLSCIPALFALIFLLRPWGMPAAPVLRGLFRDLILPTLLPIVILLPATAAFGEELEDDTLPYLLMKPISRARIVLGKYLATILVTITSLWIGLLLTTFIISRAERVTGVWEQLWPMAAAAAAGAMLLGAVFILVSLISPRALLAGMLYIFAWESLLGRFLPGVRAISSRESMQRIYEALMDNDLNAAGQAFLPMVVVTVIALVLAIWRLRTMQID